MNEQLNDRTMYTYKLNWIFADGYKTKLVYTNQNKHTEARQKFSFDKLKEQFKKDNPTLFSDFFQKQASERLEIKELQLSKKMFNYIDNMNLKADINEAMNLLDTSLSIMKAKKIN